MHLTTNCLDYTAESIEENLVDQLATWTTKYSSIPVPVTNRTHCIVWSDYTSHPKVELAHGIRFDTNYYYWPGTWILDRPGLFTGSAMPMRFADVDGTLIDVYQAATQMTDESEQTYPLHINALLDRALGAEGYYGVFTANMHTDSNPHAGSDAIVASAKARNVPVVTAKQMLAWLDGRNASAFSSLNWTGGTLTFTLTQGAGAFSLQVLLPTQSPSGTLVSITRGGSPVTFTTQTIKGVSYATFIAPAGAYTAAYTNVPPPDTTINAAPSNPTTSSSASFGFVSVPAGATFECSLDGSVFAACVSPQNYSGLGLGGHSFQVRAVGIGGVDASPASFAWTINPSSPPDTTITATPANPTMSTSATFSFTSVPAGATFECSLDGATFTACASPQAYSGLVLGSHTFQVRAVNVVGPDPTPANYTWTINSIGPPDTTITSSPSTSTTSTSASFTFTSTPAGATFECAIDGGALTACTSPRNYTSLSVATHTFQVRATNAGGTDLTPASFTWTITAAPPSLVAAYGFEEGTGTTTADSSGLNNTGTLSNATWATTGRFGKALSFNGTNAWVTVPDANVLDLTTTMTIEAWVNPTTLTSWRTIVLKESTSGLSYGLYAHDGSRPAAYIRIGSSDIDRAGTAVLPTNTWTHVAMTYDGTTLRLYVNGAQVATRAISGSIVTSTGALRIGGNASWGEYYAGLIDEIRIYSRVLTAAEITADMNTAVKP